MTELSNEEIMLLDAYTTNVAFDYGLLGEQSEAMLAHVNNVAKEREIEGDLNAMFLILEEFYQGSLGEDQIDMEEFNKALQVDIPNES